MLRVMKKLFVHLLVISVFFLYIFQIAVGRLADDVESLLQKSNEA
jgi:hypothetical protein